jgi:hypothetical protein
MTIEELKGTIERLKAQGETDEQMLAVFYGMYIDDKITLENLRTMIDILGYEFTEEFEAMSEEDKKTKGWETEDEPAAGVDKEEIEDAKEYETEGEDDGEEKAPEKEAKDEDEEDDDKKAARLFGFGDKK